VLVNNYIFQGLTAKLSTEIGYRKNFCFMGVSTQWLRKAIHRNLPSYS